MLGERKTLGATDNLESIPEITKRLGWRLYVGAILYTIAILFVTMRWCPKYYWSAIAAAGVIAATIIRFWAFSRRLWCWITIVVVVVLQVPLVLVTNELGTEFQGITAETMLQGPFSDAMTHVGQLAMLRRLAGSPVPPENFLFAAISPANLGVDQPLPVKPDKNWPERL
jgi:hypothetical protein